MIWFSNYLMRSVPACPWQKLTVLLESANPSKPRDIIVKLTSYRAKLYLRRSKLKDVGYKSTFINEDLTSKRSSLLFNARALVKSGRLLGAWSSDGTILIKDSKSKIHRVSNNVYVESFRSDDSNRWIYNKFQSTKHLRYRRSNIIL